MFHIGRCGSTVLAEMLDQHSLVDWDGEVFQKRYRNRLTRYVEVEYPTWYLRQRMLRRKNTIYGFETKIDQHVSMLRPTLHEFIEGLRNMGIEHFIVLTRRNILRRHVSSLIGRKTQVWHRWEEPAQLRRVKVDVDDADRHHHSLFESIAYWKEQVERCVRILPEEKTLQLAYEDDIISDPRVAYQKVCDFLEIAPESVTIDLKKSNPFPLSDIVVNYGEVRDALAGTRFEWMLNA